MNPLVCPKCGEHNPGDALFCGGCGQKIEQAHAIGVSPRPVKQAGGRPIIAVFVAMIVMGIGAAVFFVALEDEEPNAEAVNPLTLLEQNFDGGFTADQIKNRLDKVFVLYDVALNNENYYRYGTSLTALRFEFDVAEMVILDKMLESYNAGVSRAFEEAAREAARSLGH